MRSCDGDAIGDPPIWLASVHFPNPRRLAPMRSASISVAAFAFCAGTLMMTRDAHALGPVDLEVGAKVGVGTNPISDQNGTSTPNPLGFGLGARGGVSFLGIYAGVQLMYYFGSSQ